MKRVLVVFLTIWICLGVIAGGAWIIGEVFASERRINLRNANAAMVMDDYTGAAESFKEAIKSEIAEKYAKMVNSTALQFLIPFKWNELEERCIGYLKEILQLKREIFLM